MQSTTAADLIFYFDIEPMCKFKTSSNSNSSKTLSHLNQALISYGERITVLTKTEKVIGIYFFRLPYKSGTVSPSIKLFTLILILEIEN